jgi:hypothetical protein
MQQVRQTSQMQQYSISHFSSPQVSFYVGTEQMDHGLIAEGKALRGSLTTQEYTRHDKTVFAQFLKYISAEVRTGKQPLNLASNEELPRLIPVLCNYFSRKELTELIGEHITNEFMQMHRLEMLQNLFLESELRRVLLAFNEANIPLMLFKGPVLAYTVYPKPHMRTYHDIDALIQPGDLAHAQDVLTQMGYSFYNEYRADAVDEERTGYHFSLQSPGSPFAAIIELHTAPHASEIGTLFDREALWKNATAMTILDQPVVTMNPADHLLYLCWHYRFHGFTRLLWLYDLVMMLRAYGNILEWERLIRTAHQQDMAATLYYCLSWCHELFDIAIPEAVFSQLCPPVASRLIVERIALPDIARHLSIARYQKRRLIARRAMVSSNRDLLKAGLRMFFPSPVALQKRYMDHSWLPLRLFFLFYFIHPWTTLAKGCRLLFKRQK